MEKVENIKNYKNIIQEYCQKNLISLPKYDTIMEGEENGKIIWKARLDFCGSLFEGRDFKKTKAEINAAESCFNIIKNDINIIGKNDKKSFCKNSRIQKVDNLFSINLDKYSSIVLIDGENYHPELYHFDIYKSILFLFFVAKNTTKNVFEYQIHDNCYVFISEAIGKDAADHLLTFSAGQLHLLLFDKNVKFYVLTHDHYGIFLEKFMQNCKYICSFSEL